MGADALIGGIFPMLAMMIIGSIMTLFNEFFSSIFGDNDE